MMPKLLCEFLLWSSHSFLCSFFLNGDMITAHFRLGKQSDDQSSNAGLLIESANPYRRRGKVVGSAAITRLRLSTSKNPARFTRKS
jgi:hypothetical protein